MPLGTPALVASGGAVADNATSTAYTPTANALQLAFVAGRASSAVTDPDITGAGGLTWSPITLASYDIGSGIRVSLRAFAAVAPSSPSSIQITGTATGAGRTVIEVVEVTGASPTITNFDDGVDASAGDPAIVLPSAPVALVIACFAGAMGTAVAPPSGFTEIVDNNTDASLTIEVAYDATSPPTSFAYATSATNPTVAIGLEVSAAALLARFAAEWT